MINITKDIVIIQSGAALENSIKIAISKAKSCVCKELYQLNSIPPSKVTSSTRNEFYNASIVRLFEDHISPTNAPQYNETWVKNAHKCTKKTPEASIAKQVVVKSAHDWLNKSSLERLTRDCLLILHFLWQEKAVLLPVDMIRPVVGDLKEKNSNNYEFAAPYYTEVLALVRAPFLSNATHKDIPDITSVMKPSALRNFDWYAWRMIRCSDWHKIEDINPHDISAIAEHLNRTRNGDVNWFKYPIAPVAFWQYIQLLYPQRCQQDATSTPIRNHQRATKKALLSGEFALSDKHKEIVKCWLGYQDKFVQLQKSRGIKTYNTYAKSLTNLNTYLFGELPAIGITPPYPKQFNRKHIEGDQHEGFLSYLRKGRSNSSIQNILYKIDSFFDYLNVNSSADKNLSGFINPISEVDYPIVKKPSSSTKAAFESGHFPHLLQYCYAIESFGTYLADKVHDEQIDLFSHKYRAVKNPNNWNDAQKIISTEKFGYVPIVFYRNPLFDPAEPKSKTNSPVKYEALRLIPRFTLPIIEHAVERNGKWVFYPQLTYIRHNVIALETGIRSIHIRWLDKRTYDRGIDRSKRLPPLCNLHINTDKVNNPWDAKVSKNVIEVLDRHKNMLPWFNEPNLDEEVWYDYHEGSEFGKIVPIFRKGGEPGVLRAGGYANYFKKLIYSFDLFCRFQLGIATTNKMPEALSKLETIDNPCDYLTALKLTEVACEFIEHTPHSCRVSVVSELIRILPPHIIGMYITGQATVEHVIYYAKLDPAYLKIMGEYQQISIEQGWLLERPAMSTIKAEDINSKLQQAFRRDKEKSLIDFGAISFDRETKNDVRSGIKAARQRPIDSLAFMPTHICVFGNQCPPDVIDDLGAIPGLSTPCGGCYYSIKTVDHLPRIHGLIRVYTDECCELESHIAEAKKNGASTESLVQKANRRKFLASEIISWSITAHCLEQMYKEIKTRSSFLVEKPEIVSEHLERIVLEDHTLSNLIARTTEAKSHAEFFTPQLKQQILFARNKLLAFTGDFNRMLQEAPSGFTLIDEFRGLIRSACEVLGLSLHDLSDAMKNPMTLEYPDLILKLISSTKETSE
ncbi:hypothetical protein LJR071_001522 [Pseudomonas sp. LjRoot71]|uniref:hypothetical protein n=1 Tax=Pseudomonas sp. LjRoot71 TaxID=3342336 RepID=UPI003ECE94CD